MMGEEVLELRTEVVRNVNAVNRVAPTDATRSCAVNLRGVIESFRNIVAPRGKGEDEKVKQ